MSTFYKVSAEVLFAVVTTERGRCLIDIPDAIDVEDREAMKEYIENYITANKANIVNNPRFRNKFHVETNMMIPFVYPHNDQGKPLVEYIIATNIPEKKEVLKIK